MFNFHEIRMQEDKTRAFQEESRAARIDAMADDIYAEKLASLPNGQAGTTGYRSTPGYNFWSTLDDIKQVDLIPVARAIIANDATEVGALMIKLVTAQLRKDAVQEADDWDESWNERKYGSV